MLITRFEELRMEEDEQFIDFTPSYKILYTPKQALEIL